MTTVPPTNPTALAAQPHKTTADNGGSFDQLLQTKNQINFVVNPTDLATALTAIIAIRNGLVAIGVMKAS